MIKGTESKISCAITEIGTALTISWSGFDIGDENYSIEPGNFNTDDSTQTSVLTVKSEKVLADNTFTCTVSSLEKLASETLNFDVNLRVYG